MLESRAFKPSECSVREKTPLTNSNNGVGFSSYGEKDGAPVRQIGNGAGLNCELVKSVARAAADAEILELLKSPDAGNDILVQEAGQQFLWKASS